MYPMVICNGTSYVEEIDDIDSFRIHDANEPTRHGLEKIQNQAKVSMPYPNLREIANGLLK